MQICLRLNVEDLTSSVLAAVGTNPVRQHLFPAVGADHQLGRADGVVCAAAVASSLAQFSLW